MLSEEREQQDLEAQDANLSHASTTEDDAYEHIADYWAAERDGEKLRETLKAKEENFYQAADRRGLFELCRQMYAAYYGTTTGVNTGSSQWQTQMLRFTGDNGELIEFSANELRSYVDQIVNMMTKTRPSFQCESLNTDYASMAQVEADDAMVTYFYEQEQGERREKELAKLEMLYGKAYQHSDWDPDGGPKVDVPADIPLDPAAGGGTFKQTKKVPSGKFELRNLNWWEVICEPYRSEYNTHLWRMVVLTGKSKAEAQLRWPAFADAIAETSDDNSEWSHRFPGADSETPDNEDEITWRIFYHARTAVLPRGRKCIFVGDVWVNCEPGEDELPIDEIPVTSLMSCELHGTSFGVSDMWNLMPLEQVQNQILSDMATNIESFGRPPLMLPEGANIDLDALADGQKVVFVPPDVQQPAPMRFPEIPAIGFKVLDLLRSFKQSISQLNAISRGDTAQGVTSGAHAALYEQIAVEAQSPRALSLDLLREATGNILIQFLQAFAKHPQLVSIVGIDERPYLKTFYPENFAGVPRVKVKTRNPALETISGKTAVVDMLRQFPGMPLSDPQAVIDLITTGKMKPMYNLTRTVDLQVRYENEQLLQGPPVEQTQPQVDPATGMQLSPGYPRVPTVPALALENIQKHIVHHLEVLYSPEARENPQVMQAVLAHITEHIQLAKQVDPWVAQVLGNPPPPAAMMPVDGSAQPPGGVPSGGEPSQKQTNDAQKALTDPDAQDDSRGARKPTPAKPPAPAGRPATGQQPAA